LLLVTTSMQLPCGGCPEAAPSQFLRVAFARKPAQFSSVMPSMRREKDGAEMYSDS